MNAFVKSLLTLAVTCGVAVTSWAAELMADGETLVSTIERSVNDTVTFSNKEAESITVNSTLLANTVTTKIDVTHKANGQDGTYHTGAAGAPTETTYFTPNANVGSGGEWTATFTVAKALTLNQLVLNARTFTAGGGGQNTGTKRKVHFAITFQTADDADTEPTWTCGEQTVDGGTAMPYTFSGEAVTLAKDDTIMVSCDRGTETQGTFVALENVVLEAVLSGTTWSDVAGEATEVMLDVAGTPTLTMDVAGGSAETPLTSLTVNETATSTTLTLAGEQALTVATTTLNTNVDVSGITAELGAVTIAEGKTLTVGANTTWTSLTGMGTLRTKEATLTGDFSGFTGTVELTAAEVTVATDATLAAGMTIVVGSGTTLNLKDVEVPDAAPTIEVEGTAVISAGWASHMAGTGEVKVVVPAASQGADYPVTLPETLAKITFVNEAGEPLTGYLPDGRYFAGSVSVEVINPVTFSGASATETTVSGLLAGTMNSTTVTTTGDFASTDIFQTAGNAIVTGYSDKTTYFKPNVNVGSGNPWSATFTVAQDVEISKITLKAFAFNKDGATQRAARKAIFTCAFANEATPSWSSGEVTFTGSNTTVAPTWVELTGEASKTLTKGQTITISCSRGTETNAYFAGLVGIEVTTTPATWSEVKGDVVLTASGKAVLQMDVEATVTSLTVDKATDGASLLLNGEALTSTTTTINVDTDVSEITADLGVVTVAEGATLTIGENTKMSSLTLNGTLRGTGTLPATLTIGANGMLDTTAGTLKVPANMTWQTTGMVRIRIDEAPTGAANLIFPSGTTLPANVEIFVGESTEAADLVLALTTGGIGVLPTSAAWLKVDGQWVDTLENAFAIAGTTKPVTVAVSKTITSLDLSNGECAEDFNLAGITKANLAERTLAFEGEAVLTVGTLNLGWNRSFMGWAEDGETPLYSSDKLVVTEAVTMKEGPIEGSPVLVTWSWGGAAATTPAVTMTTANGGTLTIGNGLTYTAPTADALGTLTFDTSLTGKGCWYEWLFGVADAAGNETTTTAASTGRKTNVLDGTKTYLSPAITVDGKTHQAISLSGSGTPNLAVDYTDSLESPNWSASLFARIPSNAGGILIAFGAANSTNKALVLMRGAEKNQMLLVYMPGDTNTCAEVLANMPVAHGEDAYHLYSFVKYGEDPDDSTTPRIEIFLDNEKLTTVRGDYSVSPGLQLGKTYGGIYDFNKWTVNGITVTKDDGTEENLPMVQGTSGAIDMLRIYDCYLTEAEVARIAADGYTYVNEDVYTREVSGEVSWNTANAWTKEGETTPAHAEPVEEATVTLKATADTTITMNPSATVGTETVTERLLADLTIGKLNEDGTLDGNGTINFKLDSGSPHMKVEGVSTVNTSAVVDCLALTLEGPVHVAAGKTLTFELPAALLAKWAEGGVTVTKPLTGELTLEGEGETIGKIAVTHGDVPNGCLLSYGYNSKNHHYEATLTVGGYDYGTATTATWGSSMWGAFEPTETTPIILIIAENATLDMGGEAVSTGTLTIKRADSVTEGLPAFTITNGSLTPSAIVLENTTLVLEGSDDAAAPTEYTMNISGTGAVKVASGYVTLSGTNTYEGGTEIVGATEDGIAGATVTMGNKDALGSGAVTGAGTVIYSNVDHLPTDVTLFGTAGTDTTNGWRGTVVLQPCAFTGFDKISNTASNVKLEATSSLFDCVIAAGTYDFNQLIVEQGVTWRLNGNENNRIVVDADLIGEGTIQFFGATGNHPEFFLAGDTSGFSGQIEYQDYAQRYNRVILGTTDEVTNLVNGVLIVGKDHTAQIASGKTWRAARGMRVDGTLCGAGTITLNTGALTFADGATLEVTDVTTPLTATGTVTFDTVTDFTVVFATAMPTAETKVLATSSAPTGMPATCTVKAANGFGVATLTAKDDGLYITPDADQTFTGTSTVREEDDDDTLTFAGKTETSINVNSDFFASVAVDQNFKTTGGVVSNDPEIFTPNANIGSGGTWTATFTPKAETTVTLDALTLFVKLFKSSGVAQQDSVHRQIKFDIKKGDDVLPLATGVLDNNKIEATDIIQVPITFTSSVDFTNTTPLTIYCYKGDTTAGTYVGLMQIDFTGASAVVENGSTWTASIGNREKPILTVDGDVALYVEEDATVTALTVNGTEGDPADSLTLLGSGILTVGTTTINADTDVSAITANLGAVTVAAGVTLTIGEHTTYTVADGSMGTIISAASKVFPNDATRWDDTTIAGLTEDDSVIITLDGDRTIELQSAIEVTSVMVKGTGTLTLTATEGSSLTAASSIDMIENTSLTLASSAVTSSAIHVKTASNVLTLNSGTYANAISGAGSVTIPAGVTVTVTSVSALECGAFNGGGTVVIETDKTSPEEGLFTAAEWAGAVELKNFTGVTNSNVNFARYGNSGSKLVFNGFVGYLNSNTTTTGITYDFREVEIASGGLTINNAQTDNHKTTFKAPLTGTGCITMNKTNGNGRPTYTLIFEDGSGFKGSVDIQDKFCLNLGESVVHNNGCFNIGAGQVVTLESGKTWSTRNGVKVAGTLCGSGTITVADDENDVTQSSSLILEAGATIDASAGTAVTANTVTYPSGVLKIKVPAGLSATDGINLCVLKTTDTDAPASVEVYEGTATTPTENLIAIVKAAEGDAPAGLYVVAKPIIEVEVPSSVEDALVQAAIKEGITGTITTVTVDSATGGDKTNQVVDAVEFFDDIVKFVGSSTGRTANVKYDFGIERMTIKRLARPELNGGVAQSYIVLQVGVAGGTFKQETLVDLYRTADGETQGIKVDRNVLTLTEDPTEEASVEEEASNSKRWLVVPFSILEDVIGTTKFTIKAARSVLWVNGDGTTSATLPQTGLPNNADVSFLVTLDLTKTSDCTLMKVSGGTDTTQKAIELKIVNGELKLMVADDAGKTTELSLLAEVATGTYKVAFALTMDETTLAKVEAQASSGTLQTAKPSATIDSGNFTTWATLDADVTRLEVYNGEAWDATTIAEKITLNSTVFTVDETTVYDEKTMADLDLAIPEGATLTILQKTEPSEDGVSTQTVPTATTLALSPTETSSGTIAVEENAKLIGEDTGEPGVTAYNLSPDVTITLAAGATLQMDGRLTSPVVIIGAGVKLGAATEGGTLILDKVTIAEGGATPEILTTGMVEIYEAVDWIGETDTDNLTVFKVTTTTSAE